jgi:beta-lactam-binding protein with PASTA domain
VTVPNVVNQLRATAATTLQNGELGVGAITRENSSTIGAGRVISQTPAAGTTGVTQLTAVALVVSLGPANVTVPGLLGMTQAEAGVALATAGLGVGSSTTEPSTSVAKSLVIRSNPAVGSSVPPGTAVALVISSGFPTVLVPGLVGLTEPAALAALDTAGLTVGTVTQAFSDTVDAGVVISQDPAPEGTANPGSAVSFVVSRGPATVEVPTVVGLPEASAKDAITTATLTVGTITTAASTTVTAGNVISQNPEAGIAVAPGSSVSLVISTGSGSVTVPNVVGMLQGAATTALGNVGLTVGTVTAQANAAAVGTVLSQNPLANASAASGSAVALTVSSGPAPVTVPNVVGMLQGAATTALGNVGLTVGTVTQQTNAAAVGTVLTQNPAANASAAPGSAVALTVSSGPATSGDTVKPVPTAPTQRLDLSALPSASATTAVNTRLSWSATDNVGVLNYDVQRSTNGSTTWTNELSASTAVVRTAQLTPGTTYQFRMRARDAALNVSDYATGSAFKLALNQESVPQVVYAGTWTPETISTASGGAQRFASAANATATFTFTGTGIGWVSVKHNTRGRAEVLVDGVSAGTIDLFQTSTTVAPRRVVFERTFPSRGTHTIQIRALGTKATASTSTRIDVDGFVVVDAQGTAPLPVAVPSVVGQSQASATTILSNAGLVVGQVAQQADAAVSGTVLAQSPTAGTSVAQGSGVNLTVSSGPSQQVAVPNVTGQVEATARTNITNAGLVPGTSAQESHATIAAGSVVRTSPVSGTSVARNSTVNLVISSGPAAVNVNVPNVTGQVEATARTNITNAGLVPGTSAQESHATIAAGSVVRTSPVSGTSVARNSTVNLVVSTGPAVVNVNVPNVTGQVEATARTNITNAGLFAGTTSTESHDTIASGNIIRTSPLAGTSVARNSTVNLVRSLGPAAGVDGVGPVAAAPVEAIDLSSLATSTVPVRMTWSATDTGGSGVARYEVQRSTNNGGTWTAEALSTPLTTVKTLTLTPGTSYRFRVRAVDVAGNIGAYATATAFVVGVSQETLRGVSPTVPRLAFVGTWTNEAITTASGGAQVFGSASGANATFTFTGRTVAWAATKANSRGRAQVFIDGVSAGTIDLYQSATTAAVRRVVFQRSFPTVGTHTIEIRVLGTKTTASTGTRVDVDAFVTTQ